MQSLIQLTDGAASATVIAADLYTTTAPHLAPGQGVVIGDRGDIEHQRYVVWTVSRQRDAEAWVASNGDYCSTLERALEHYDLRRAERHGALGARAN